MKFGSVLAMASYLLGGARERRQVILSCDSEKITLPVTPEKYSVQTSQSNKVVDILDFGEALIFGNVKLKKLKLSSFFPSPEHSYPFAVGTSQEPEACITLLTKWKEQKAPVRVIITQSPINLAMAIMNFDYREQDGSRDIYFDLSLTEYKDLNVPPAEYQKQVDDTTGLKDRPTDLEPTKQQKMIQNCRDAVEIAKQAYGSYKDLQKFKDKNAMQTLLLKTGRDVIAGKYSGTQSISTNKSSGGKYNLFKWEPELIIWG